MPNIPVFPEFKLLDLSHKAEMEAYFAKYPPVASELNFTEIFAWRPTRNTKVSMHDGNICIGFEKDKKHYYAVAGGARPSEKAVREVLKNSRDKGMEAEALFFTEEQAREFEAAGGFEIKSDRDSSDYVYLTSDLIELKGRKYDGKRNQIKQFMKNYEFEFVDINKDTLPEAVAFQEEWCRKRPCADGTMLADESVAIGQMFEWFFELSIYGSMLRVNGKTAAYTLAGVLNPDTAVVYVEKASHDYKGIYQALNQMFAEKHLSKYKFINREQDVGDDGLRHAKLSYHPHHLVHKYSVKLKT